MTGLELCGGIFRTFLCGEDKGPFVFPTETVPWALCEYTGVWARGPVMSKCDDEHEVSPSVAAKLSDVVRAGRCVV